MGREGTVSALVHSGDIGLRFFGIKVLLEVLIRLGVFVEETERLAIKVFLKP